MAQSIEIPVSLGLKDAQSQINQLRQTLQDSVKLDSSAGKSLTSILSSAQKMVDNMTGKMSTAFKSTSGSQGFLREYEKLIGLLNTASSKMSNLGISDIKFSVEDQQAVDNTVQKIQELQQVLNSIQSGKAIEVIKISQADGIENLRQQLDALKIDASKFTFDEIGDKLSAAAQKASGTVTELTNQITNINSQISTLNTTGFEEIAKLSNTSTKGVSQIMDADHVDSVNAKLQQLAATMTEITVKPMTVTSGDDIGSVIDAQTKRIEKEYNTQIALISTKKQEINDLINEIKIEGTRTSANGKTTTGHWTNDQMAQLMSDSRVTNIIEKLKADSNLNFDNLGIREQFAKFREALSQELNSLNTQEVNLQQLRDKVREQVTQVFDGAGEAVVGSKSQFQAAIKNLFSNLGINGNELKKIFDVGSIESGEKVIEVIDRIKAGLADYISTLDQTANTDLAAQLKEAQAAFESLTSAQNTNKSVSSESGAAIQSLQAQINDLSQKLQDLLNKYNELAGKKLNFDNGNLDGAKEKIEGYIASLNKLQQKQKALSNVQMAVNRWMGFWQVLNMTKKAVNDMKQHLQELDTVMTSISVVTNFSQEDLWGQISQYSEIARQYGVAIKGVYEVSQIYYQQGLQQNDVMTLTTETLKMARIAGLDYATAADYMTTAIRGFKLEMTDAAHVTDVFSALAATTASSTEEIATAISKTAASAEAVGASFEATSAMMATMIATTRESATNIGTALKSVISRYGEMTSDPSKMVDSEGEEMSLNRVDKALQTVGITIHDTAGQFRDFDDVMLELMEKWDSLDSLSQRYIATLMAGNRQQSRFLALVSNVDEYKKALQTAVDSEGTGELQTLKTLDSIDAKIEKMKVTIQEFYTSSGLEELYKKVLDTITNIVSAANSLPKMFGKIPGVAISIGASIISTIKSVLTLFINSIAAGLEQVRGKNLSIVQGLVEIWRKGGADSRTAYNNELAGAGTGAGAQQQAAQSGFWKKPSSGAATAFMYGGAAASALGSILTISSLNQYGASTSVEQDKAAGGSAVGGLLLSTAGGALSGAAVGGIPGAIIGGVASLVTQIPNIVSAVNMINVNTARRVQLAEKAAAEEKTKASKSQAETKGLEKAINTYKELESKAYDSAEAMQAFKDHMNTLADSYPQLISYMDNQGNYILELSTLENALAVSREKTAIATANAAKAELDAQKETNNAWKETGKTLKAYDLDYSSNKYEPLTSNDWVKQQGSWEGLWRAYGWDEEQYEGKDAQEKLLNLYNGLVINKEDQITDLGDFADTDQREKITKVLNKFYEENTNDLLNTITTQVEKLQSIDSSLTWEELTGFSSKEEIKAQGINVIKAFRTLDKRVNDELGYYNTVLTNVGNTLIIDRAKVSLTQLAKDDTLKSFDYTKHEDLIAGLVSEDPAKINEGTKEEQNWLDALAQSDTEDSDAFENAVKQKTKEYTNYFKAHQETLHFLEDELDLNTITSLKDLDTLLSENLYDDTSALDIDKQIAEIYRKRWQDARNTILTNYNEQITNIFGKDNIPEIFKLGQDDEGNFTSKFSNSTITAIQSNFSTYQKLLDKQQYAQAEAYFNNMQEIYGEKGLGGLSGENQTKAYDIIKDLDFSDPEALRSAAETFAGMGSDFKGLSKIFTDAALHWTTNAATLLEQLASATKDTAKSIESSLSDMSKVFKYSEALEKAQALMDANEGVKFDQLFTYDKDLGGYVKTAKAFQLEMAELQNQQIEGISLAITDMTETLPSVFNDKDFINLANSGRTIETGQVKEKFAELTHTKEGEANFDRLWLEYTQIIEAFRSQDKDWNTFITRYINEHGTQLQLQLDEINNMSSQMASLQLESFDYASIVSGKGTVQSKESIQALLTQAIDPAKFKLNQERFNEEYAKLITGDLDSWNTYIDELNTKTGSNIAHADRGQANRARFEGLTSLYQKIASGDVIWDALTQQEQELLNSVEGVNLTEGASAAQVGTAADNVWAAIIKLINAGAGTLNEVADTIAGKADKDFKDSNAGKQYNLLTSYKDGFTSQEAQELGLLDDNGKLKAEFSSYLERDSNGNWVAQAGQNAASVIQNLARLLNISIDKTTDEYKDAIKEGIDQAIAEADKADIGKQRVNAWQSIMSGKVTDRISLANVDSITKYYMKAAGLISDINADFVYIQSEEQLNNAIEWMRSKLSDQSFVQRNQQTARYFQQLVSDFESKTAKNAAFEGIVGEQFNQSAAEALSMALQNTTEYSKVQSLMTEMGFKWDQAAQVWKASAESIEAARQKIAQSHLAGEIDSEEYYQLQAQLNETANAINPKTKQDNVILDMLSNYTEASEAIKAAFKTQFSAEMVSKGLNLNNIFKANDNGTYDIDVGALKSFLDSIGFEYDEAAMSQIQTITDSYLNNIKTATTYTTQGASSLADVDAFKQSYADIVGKTLSDDAFSYSSVLQSFVLDESYMDEYINAQRKKLRQLNYSEEFIEQYIKDQTDRAIQDSIALDGFLNAATSTERNDEANKLFQQIKGLSNYQEISRSAIRTFYPEYGMGLQAAMADIEEESFKAITTVLESGGQAAVDLLKQIKPKASSDELEAVYNNAINKLRTAQEDLGKGVGETISGLAADIGEVTGALDVVRLDDGTAVITAVHDMVNAYAAIYAAMEKTAGHTTADLNSAYVNMLTAASQNNVTAKETLENAYSMSYQAFGELMDQYGLNMKEVLSNVSTYGRIINDGFGNLRIEDFNQFAKGMGWDINSPEFAESYSAWIDAKVEMQNKPAEMVQNAADQLKSIAEAKPGEAVNVSYLQKQLQLDSTAFNALFAKYGATVYNGILKLSQNVDIPGLISAIGQQAAEAGQLLPEQLAELQDTIEGLLSEITDLIAGGIEGKLSNADAQQLTNWAKQYGIQDLDFSRTSEGLKLSSTSAKELYNTISEIDSIQGNIVFDALKDSLIESNEQLRSVASTTAYIQTLTKQLETLRAAEKTPDNAKRIANLEKELALAKKINETRSIDTEDDSFNFMSNDIPSAQNNPLNYWKNWTDAFSTIKDSMKGGKAKNTMAYDDFYNIITEMGNIASLTKDGIKWGKETLTNSQDAADLITKAAGALKSVDGELVVDLSKIHMDINTDGLTNMAKDVNEGLDAFAQEQINMLDSIIAVLEVIVAMEDLEKIDIDQDLEIELPEIAVKFGEGDGDDAYLDADGYIIQFNETYSAILTHLKETAALLSDGQSVYEVVSVNTSKGSYSIADILGATTKQLKEWGINGKQYTTLMSNLLKMSKSDAYDDLLDNNGQGTIQSLVDLFQNYDWGDMSLSANTGKYTYTISETGSYEFNWDKVNYDNLINAFSDEYQGKREQQEQDIQKDLQDILDKQRQGQTLEVQEAVKLKIAENRIQVQTDANGKKTYLVNGHTYDSKEKANIASEMFDAGALSDDFDFTKNTKGQVIGAEGTVKIGNYEMKIVSEGTGKAQYVASDGTKYNNQADALKASFIHDRGLQGTKTIEDIDTGSREYQTWEVEQGIRLEPIYNIDGQFKAGDIKTDTKLRSAVSEYLKSDNIEKLTLKNLTSNGQAIKVPIADGIELTLPTNGIKFKNDAEVQQYVNEAINSDLGIDLNLKDTITQGVKEAFSALPEAINSIEPTKITSVSDALNGITTALAAVVRDTNWDTLIAKLQEVASAASGINLPTGGNGNEPETPSPSNQNQPQEETETSVQTEMDQLNTDLANGVYALTQTGINAGTAVTEALSSAAADGLNTLSKGITEVVESIDHAYTDLKAKTEEVAGTIKSHWEALVTQITDAVTLIQSLVQSLQEKISITWTIGSEGGKSDLSSSGSGVNLDPTRGATALTEYMDKMLSTMEHNKEKDTFKVTMPALTIDTSTAEVNIDDIGKKVQEEAAKEPVKEVKVSVGTITSDLTNANVDVASINEKVKTETKANPISSLDTLVNSITPDLTGTTVDTAGINKKVQTEVTKNPISNLNVAVSAITPDVSEATPADIEVFPKPLIIKSAKAKIETLADPLDLTEINDLGVQKLNENASMVLTDVKAVPTSLSLSLDSASQVSIDESTPVVLSKPVKVPAEVDTEDAKNDIDTLKTKIGEIKQESKPKIFVDINPAISILNALHKAIADVKQKKAPQITVDTEVAKANLNEIIEILDKIIKKAQSLMIKITTAQETYQTSALIRTIKNNLTTIETKKTQTITISGGDWQKLISDLNDIASALERIQGASGINIDVNGGPKETPEGGETPKEGETSQENQPTTTTTEVSQQTKVTTPGGTEIEMNAKVVATEVDGSQAPAMEMPVEAGSVTAGANINTVSVPTEAESVDVPSDTTVAVQASIEVGEAGQNLQLTATYTATVVNQPADANNLNANYKAIVTGAPGNIYGLEAHYTAVLDHGLGGGANGAHGNFGLASGTLGRMTGPAHAQSTLMGELGPELVISHGRYFVVGQDGAEMVDLDKDAIVFNHLQTEQLLKNGMSKERGRAVTNERNAVAFAKGNIGGGPAMASASAALAVLKQIRSMWQSLLTATAKDLAGAGGSGGGGGGGKDKGGKGSDAGRKSFIEDVERWYNLMQEIAKLEKVINHEETLRAKLEGDLHKNGSAYYKSQKESLSAIQKEIKAQEELNISRREYFNQRRKQLNEDNGPFNQLYEFDPQGQLKYKDNTTIKGSKATNGYAFLADLMAQDPNTGKPKYTVEQQYKILKKAGFAKYMKFDSSGNEIKLGGTDSDEGPSEDDYNTYYSSMVQAFWDRVEAQKSEMQTLYDSVAEGENSLLEKEQARNELLEAMYDNQKELENSVLNAIEDMKQREIDALQDERDKLEEATGKYIDGLSEALDKERQMYDTQENQNELDTKKRRLGILQRSGASAEDIYSLQKEITESEKNMYFDAQQAQIDAIQQASDLEIERLDTQIQIMQDTLDFQKEMGLLWYQVYDVMGKSSAEITQFVMGNDSQFWNKSPLESAQTYENTLFSADQWKSFAKDTQDFIQWTRDSQTADALSTYSDTMSKQHDKDDFWKNNKERYEGKFTEVFEKTGDRTKAATEASKLFETDKSWYDRETAAGNKFIGTEEKDYEPIDDTYHWVLTYKKEVYGGLNTQYQNKGEQLYFESKKKEEHKWENGECKYCHRKKPKKKKSSSGGGWSSSNCNDSCSGVCKGAATGGTSCSKNCENECRGGCKTSCQGGCKNGCKQSCQGCAGGCKSQNRINSSSAKGNFAFAKGKRTLVGELGPELVVSNGQYHIAGRNGAEFVNLPDDAIVFNHMQTRSLLRNGRSGRGKSVVSDARSIALSSYANQVNERRNSTPFSQLYEFDSQGRLKYKSNTKIQGSNLTNAYAFLADLMSMDAKGNAKYSAKQQYEILKKAGFEKYMEYDSSGNKIKLGGTGSKNDQNTYYHSMVQAFWDKIEADKSSMQALYASIAESEKAMQKIEQERNKALQQMQPSGNIIIENASVNMNVQKIANDYDAKRAGEQALNEMLRIANKTSAANNIRR